MTASERGVRCDARVAHAQRGDAVAARGCRGSAAAAAGQVCAPLPAHVMTINPRCFLLWCFIKRGFFPCIEASPTSQGPAAQQGSLAWAVVSSVLPTWTRNPDPDGLILAHVLCPVTSLSQLHFFFLSHSAVVGGDGL